MLDTYPEEVQKFERGQQLTFTQVRGIVAPESHLDEVERFRLERIGTLANEMLDPDTIPHEASTLAKRLGHLGGSKILAFIPE